MQDTTEIKPEAKVRHSKEIFGTTIAKDIFPTDLL
jgi:hypothetical protein